MTFFRKPVRIRSKICVLLYKNCELEILDLKCLLKKRFDIKVDSMWNYIFRSETVGDRKDILIFLEFKNVPDVYSNRLTLSDENIEPSIWCFSEPTFALYSILKFCNLEEYQRNMVTNMVSISLAQYVTITEPDLSVAESVKTPKVPSKKRPLRPKQIDTIDRYMEDIDSLMAQNSQDFNLLKRLIQNILNYRKYEMTAELTKKIIEYQRRVSYYASPKNPKNQIS